MDGTPASVWDYVKPLAGSLREQWDENVTSFEIIQSFTDVSLSKRPSATGSAEGPVACAEGLGCLLARGALPKPGPAACNTKAQPWPRCRWQTVRLSGADTPGRAEGTAAAGKAGRRANVSSLDSGAVPGFDPLALV